MNFKRSLFILSFCIPPVFLVTKADAKFQIAQNAAERASGQTTTSEFQDEVKQSNPTESKPAEPKPTELKPKGYDPGAVTELEIKTLELIVNDGTRNREFPILVYLPESADPAAVIIHSHGLGGQKETSPFLGNHWAARGYVAVFLQHPGSDNSVWEDVPRREMMAAMKKAANAENFMLRLGDVSATIDQLETWNQDHDHPLGGRLDLEHIGMSGHSFGAKTTQSVSGQKSAMGNKTDPRIDAAIPMSPSLPKRGNARRAFEDVKIPWLCMTGTKDQSIMENTSPESRLGVFKALPAGDKFELVLHDARHSVFTETNLQRKRRSDDRNPNHHRAIKAITTAFWDAYLKEDESAKAWIGNKQSVQTVLEPKDTWRSK